MSLIPFSFWSEQTDIVESGLILHLDALNYTSGSSTWNDLSPSADHMTMFHNGSGLPTYTSTKGGAVYFSKANGNWGRSYINVNSTTPTVITIEFWANVSSSASGAHMPVAFDTYDFYYMNAGFGFNTFNGDLYGVDGTRKANWGTELHMNHYTLVMYQNQSYSNNEIWINGVKATTGFGQQSGTENATNRVFSSDGRFTLNGFGTYMGDLYIGQCRVYNRKLSKEEIIQNYSATNIRFGRPNYKPRVSEANLTWYIDFAEEDRWFGTNGGYVTDFSGRMEWGNLTGGVAWNSGGGGHMQFRTASSRYISLPISSANFGLYYGSATFCFVVRMLDFSQNPAYIFHPTNAPEYQGDVNIAVLSNASFQYSHNSGGAPNTLANYGALSANTWYHVTMSYNYDTFAVKIYINGQPVVTNGFQERMIGIDGYYLGRNTGQYYTFDLGLFMIWIGVRSDSEILEQYNYHKTRFGLP